jgi:exodeoxyribonuclease-3
VKIATYNAAGIRARLPRVLDWLQKNPVDVLAIQEIKTEDSVFPYSSFEELGYICTIHGQKAWNGVALLHTVPLTDVHRDFPGVDFPQDRRLISARLETSQGPVRIINTYVPNGNTVGSEKWTHKMKWLEQFRWYLDTCVADDEQVIWLGDINIAPQPHDVYDSAGLLGQVGHHPDEFSRLANITEYGLIDLFRCFEFGSGHYTFWDFKIPNSVQRGIGWRIDHIYATEKIAETCVSCTIDMAARQLEKPSDHTWVVAEFSL